MTIYYISICCFKKPLRFDSLLRLVVFDPPGFDDATQELKATDAWTLFQSIDHNEDFKINLEESKPGGGNELIPPGGPEFSRFEKCAGGKKTIDEHRDDLKDGSQKIGRKMTL